MSMVPASEDFERLAVRWASSTAAKEYPNLVAMLSAFPERYAKDRDALRDLLADDVDFKWPLRDFKNFMVRGAEFKKTVMSL